MKNVILLVGSLLVAGNTYAGTCTLESVKGNFTFTTSGVSNGVGLYDAGVVFFNGTGQASFDAIETVQGTASSLTGTGSYSVGNNCHVVVFSNLNNGVTLRVDAYLDHLDTVPAVNVAYHGNLVYTSSVGYSGSGTMDRRTGKF
jgi:hypothetical protein